MDSYVAVKAYMEEADKYDQEDLNNVELLVEELAKRTRLQICQKDLPDNVLTKMGKKESSSQDYLPFGWKSKMEGNKEVISSSLFFIRSFFFFHFVPLPQVYISSDGTKCNTLRLALANMSHAGTYSQEEVRLYLVLLLAMISVLNINRSFIPNNVKIGEFLLRRFLS